MSKEKVKVMFNTDIERVLNYTGQYDDFLQENILCQCCRRPITEHNISILLPVINNGEKKVIFWCNNDECISNYRLNHGR